MKYDIPEGLSREALVDIHNDYLAIHPDIRVHNRWGDYTEYSVRIRAKEAAKLLNLDEVPGDVTWRLAFGIDEPDEEGVRNHTVDVQFHDGDEWMSAVIDPETDSMRVSAIHLIEAARAFLLFRYPVAQALIAIDERLLLCTR